MGLPSRISDLVQHFTQHIDSFKGSNYNETRARIEFIDPFFKELGWDIENTQGFAEAYKEETGYDLQTVADVEHNNLIDDQIIAEINRSIAIVSDFSDGNRGAYYEAGYAHGQGKQLIFLCKKSILDGTGLDGTEKDAKPHFDVNHRNFILWTDASDLREKLIRRINATLGAKNRGVNS